MGTLSDGDSASTDVMDSLVQASFAVIALLSTVAADHDLSLTQLRVLAILRDRAPTMTELAAHLGLERLTVSGLIDRAVGRGLVRREVSHDDRRAVRVSLTPEGRRLAAAGAEEVGALVAPLIGRLGAADQRRLGSLLSRILE